MTGHLEHAARRQLVELGRALYDRGITPGRTGNLSIRLGERVLMTPTGVSLGRLHPDALAVVDAGGRSWSGPPPTKESALHLALYERFPDVGAVAHGHTTHAVAWSCLPEIDVTDALPVLTAYYAMRVGRLPVIPYALSTREAPCWPTTGRSLPGTIWRRLSTRWRRSRRQRESRCCSEGLRRDR